MSLLDTAHEIWAAAQLLPGEGIVDGVGRVESLLSQCRKDALLEAAEIVGKSYATFKATEQAHYRLSAEPFVHENFGFNISVVRYSQYANDELRRMAESDKTTMEGEK